MIGRLFIKRKEFWSPLKEEELFDRLAKYMVGGSPDPKRIKEFFKGKLNREGHSFNLHQTFDVGNYNMIYPQINGTIERAGEDRCRIKLLVILPKSLETLFDVAFVLNILIWIVIIGGLFSPPGSSDNRIFVIGLPITLIVVILQARFYFNFKYNECEKILMRMMELEKS